MPYRLRWSEEAVADLRTIPPHVRPKIVEAAERLRHQARVQTRNRKPLSEPVEELPAGTWQVRVDAYRSFYRIEAEATVTILRVILKGRDTTAEALVRGKRS